MGLKGAPAAIAPPSSSMIGAVYLSNLPGTKSPLFNNKTAEMQLQKFKNECIDKFKKNQYGIYTGIKNKAAPLGRNNRVTGAGHKGESNTTVRESLNSKGKTAEEALESNCPS